MASSIICWLTGPQYANLICYAYVWFAVLYLFLDCNVISMSGLQFYTYVWFASLYLHLLWLLLVFSKIDLKHFIPTSGLQYYIYICYGYFCFFKFDFRHVIPTSGRLKIDFIPSSVIPSYGAPERARRGRPVRPRQRDISATLIKPIGVLVPWIMSKGIPFL